MPLAKTLPESNSSDTPEMAKLGSWAGTSPFAAPTFASTLAGLPVAVTWLLTQKASSPLARSGIETSESSRPATSLR